MNYRIFSSYDRIETYINAISNYGVLFYFRLNRNNFIISDIRTNFFVRNEYEI